MQRGGTAGPGIVAILIALVVAGCSGSGAKEQSLDRETPGAATSTVGPTPEEQALEAYEAYRRAANRALLAPVEQGEGYSPEADFTKFSFDPIRAQYEGYVARLALEGTEYRGELPLGHPRVLSSDLQAKPHPKVTITDCETESDWHAYDAQSGKRLRETKPDVPPPYRLSSTVIYFEGHWGVATIKPDMSATCST